MFQWDVAIQIGPMTNRADFEKSTRLHQAEEEGKHVLTDWTPDF